MILRPCVLHASKIELSEMELGSMRSMLADPSVTDVYASTEQ